MFLAHCIAGARLAGSRSCSIDVLKASKRRVTSLRCIVASIPFGLGWVVLVPVVLLTVYVLYKDVFGE